MTRSFSDRDKIDEVLDSIEVAHALNEQYRQLVGLYGPDRARQIVTETVQEVTSRWDHD